MRILHTSDWHLGHRLQRHERTGEFQNFCDWLLDTIKEQKVDALVVAGDIFDSSTPPLSAQGIYYNFFTKLAATGCKSAVIVAGNHDSADWLDAPREVLKHLNVFVVGRPKSPEYEVFELQNADGECGAICCAVPYLRARDLCPPMPGASLDEIRAAEIDGFRKRYSDAVDAAEKLRARREIPLIATGHCFTAGGKISEGERDISVGSVEKVPLDVFPENIDYLALGHLHRPQLCGGSETRRYSGSPLCCDFSEIDAKKQVLIVDFEGRKTSAWPLPVPQYQRMKRVKGSFEEISLRLKELHETGESVWVEVECGDSPENGLNERVRSCVPEDSRVEIMRVKVAAKAAGNVAGEKLTDAESLTPKRAFEIFLQRQRIEGERADSLMRAYLEVVDAVQDEVSE